MNQLALAQSRARAVSSPSCSLSQMGCLINGDPEKPVEGKLWKLRCHSGSVFWHNRLISTTDSKANVTGDECPQLRPATECAPTLPYIGNLSGEVGEK